MQRENKHELEPALKEAGYTYLGWRNSWGNLPDKYVECRAHQHKLDDTDLSNHRGSHHVISCDICKIWWKVDSSD